MGDIVAGFPWIQAALRDQFLPQMLDIEAFGGLSYTKGCYPGQEVVARTHYRGKVKRHLRVFGARSAAPPVPATAVLEADTGAGIGQVLDAAPIGDGDWALGAVVADDHRNAVLDLAQRPPLRVGDDDEA